MSFGVYTMGFSNRSWDDTLAILQAFEIKQLVDIRTLPGSKHTPQFNLEHLQEALPRAGIEYVHIKNLGGLRKPLKDSTANAAWRNDSFRGYADYMQTPQFETALNQLIRLLSEKTTVYCCTEAVFWRCHRQLVSDALLVRGYHVGHIFSASKVEEHQLTNFVKAHGTTVTYPDLL
ncbi:MAG TPA: DUF488 domain-containing protein [Terriglobia bacterium]|nr:DUF488 domain-containing protein [Terriglobia bacterium]